MTSRIEDYGLIGDLQTAALVSREGSVDWLCFPRFDSGACFAALLGDESNGRWLLQPAGAFRAARRRYREDTLILETELETDDGLVRLIDFMPVRDGAPNLVRIVEGVQGRVKMKMDLTIRFDYGSIVPWLRRVDGTRVAIAGPDGLVLRTPVGVEGRTSTPWPSSTCRPARGSRSRSPGFLPTARHRRRSTPRTRSRRPSATGSNGPAPACTRAAGTTTCTGRC